jgi:hypothetical protein
MPLSSGRMEAAYSIAILVIFYQTIQHYFTVDNHLHTNTMCGKTVEILNVVLAYTLGVAISNNQFTF